VIEKAFGERFPQLRIGVSACLLGQEVRYNGGHKRDGFVAATLAPYVEYVPVCPEVAIGLGIPRPSIRLVGDPERPRALGTADAALDVTEALRDFSRQQVPRLADLDGYIVKKDSPSCGMERVKVYSEKGGAAQRTGVGIFARALMERWPQLPVEEEGRLNDPTLRENFLTRVYVHHRWRRLVEEGLTAKALIAFHSDHKYLVMAHSQAAYQRLGQMLSNLAGVDLEAVGLMYVSELMAALGRRVNRKRHANVLQHMLGYLKRSIDAGDKAEMLATIEAYRRGEIPLVVPIRLFRHYFRRHPDPYMERQVYLDPHPDALALRNAI
jgi:uncharacterized protein YbgA (DUF1722 family)/uncharacterized protein YbbK (DUF523 family)